MEQQNEILTAVREGFARVDEQFAKLRREFAEQLDGVSDGLHLELRAHSQKMVERVESVRAAIEKVDSKLGLIGENAANVMHEIARYRNAVEHPFEERVTKLEGRVAVLEKKK